MRHIIILLLVPVLVFAQSSSENFILTKSVIDAGGGPASSENFEQLNAFGQPTPVGVQSSENFMLSAGFLSPRFLVSPLSPIQELVIKANQPDVNLWWEVVAGAGAYSVHRDSIPIFTPSGTNLVGTTADTFYTDTGIAAGSAEKYFYIVTSAP